MAAEIQVRDEGGGRFLVTVSEGGGRTEHQVRVEDDYARRLAGGAVPVERLLEESFRFLLEREPKESILSRFDLPAIGRYFPEYEREIAGRLEAGRADQ